MISENDIIKERQRLEVLAKSIKLVLKNSENLSFEFVFKTLANAVKKASFSALYNIHDSFVKNKKDEIKIVSVLNLQANRLKYKGKLNNSDIMQLKESGDLAFIMSIQTRAKLIKKGSIAIVLEGEQKLPKKIQEDCEKIIDLQEIVYSKENQKTLIKLFKSKII